MKQNAILAVGDTGNRLAPNVFIAKQIVVAVTFVSIDLISMSPVFESGAPNI